MQIIPRQYQLDAAYAPLKYYYQGNKGNVLICMPTGTGKSLVIGWFIQEVWNYYPGTRILVLTHRKELIKQNSNKLKEIWSSAPYGIYSAGLNKKEKDWPITFAGIASIYKCIKDLGHIDFIVIDEVHLVNDEADTMYFDSIETLKAINPYLKVIGLSATPYRQKLGYLTNGKIFTDVVFNNTDYISFNKLVADGYLSPLISKRTQTKIDISKVGIGADGDFRKNQLEAAIDTNDTNYSACKEMIEYGHDRYSWLVFASGIKHSEHICSMLNSMGIPSKAVHSKVADSYRDDALAELASGKLRCIVNNNVLTTGFDCPRIDMIGMLRPTASVGLHVQMLGRGTRPSPETMKQNCLVLDFAGNIPRLGPINDPLIPNYKEKGTPGAAPVKICNSCGTYNHIRATHCESCFFEFPITTTILPTAGYEEPMKTDLPQFEWFTVGNIVYSKHLSAKGNFILKVVYICGKKSFKEYVALESNTGIVHKARKWWKDRMGSAEAPPSVDEAIKYANFLKRPKRIQIHLNKMPYPEIINYEW